MTDPRARHHAGSRSLVLRGLALIGASFALGVILRHNYSGTVLDRWFQRLTAAGSRRPGQPGYHHSLAVVLTQTTRVGTGPALLYFTGAAVVVIICAGLSTRPRHPSARFVAPALAPVVALVLGTGSAELFVKPLINRRMIGNESVLMYPSGHSVATAAVATATALVVLRLRDGQLSPRRVDGGITVAALIGLVPVAVGLGMAVIRAHFLTDVIGGWLWGCGWGLLIGASWVRWAQRRRPTGPGPVDQQEALEGATPAEYG